MEHYNPWWKNEVDEVYEEWLKAEIRWVPKIINELSIKPFSLHFLVGPRQVGKTTLLKIFIQKLLKKKLNPKSIFYYSCDELLDYKELAEILDNYLAARKEWGIKSSVIVLDEITFVEEWYRAIKARIDRKLFRNDVLIITGSASIELLKEKERFPGRRGFGKDIFYLPMDFGEYVLNFGKIDLKQTSFSSIERVKKCINSNRLFSEQIDELFKKYLESGGYPLAIKDVLLRGKVSISTIKTYLDWLKNEWKNFNKNERYMKEIISYILKSRLSPISWLGVAKNTSAASPHTVQDYVETLERLFCVKVLNIIMPDSKVLHRKNKKVHILDPFLYRVFSHYTRADIFDEVIVESVVASHLSRVFDIYYWKNRSEVDVVAVKDGKQIGFEVKWGFKHHKKPRHLREIYTLDKESISLFLASVKW